MSSWESMRAMLINAGWRPTVEQGVELLQSPQNAMAVHRSDFEDPETRTNLKQSLRRQIETMLSYRQQGVEMHNVDGCIADFEQVIELLDAVEVEGSDETDT